MSKIIIGILLVLIAGGIYIAAPSFHQIGDERESAIVNQEEQPEKSDEEHQDEDEVDANSTLEEDNAPLENQEASDVKETSVVISGGHDTNPVDMGRPVSLIAGALNVPDEVFREAFSHVTPEDQGHLNPDTAQRNKAELLPRLEPYGVTNERLDEVTNYYRYPPQSTEIWPTEEANIIAKIQDGNIIGFDVIDGGAGYSSVPTVSVEGFGNVDVNIQVNYTQNFSTNGSIQSVTLQ